MMSDWSQILSDDFKVIKILYHSGNQNLNVRSPKRCAISVQARFHEITLFLMTEMELASVKVCQVGLYVKQAPDNAQCLLLLLYTNSNLLSDLSSRIGSILCFPRLCVFLSEWNSSPYG